jgi:DNA repair protein RecN (Recombination protein N)
MLRFLSVHNFALIDSVELSFSSGLTAITGETGSGKSILLGAFGLLLGGRSDTRSIRNPDSKCIVEAQFEIQQDLFKSFFERYDIDADPLTTIRREISPNGKSRAFINDTPVSLNMLKELGEQLVDVHSQHENSILGERAFQFSVVDAFAGNQALFLQYTEAYERYKTIEKELREYRENEIRMRQDLDFSMFQWNELNAAALDGLNQSDLEQELEKLTHAESIQTTLHTIVELFDSEQAGISAALIHAKQLIQKIAPFHPSLSAFQSRLESLSIESSDLTDEMSSFAASTDSDDMRANELNERLNGLYRLQQKYRLQSVEELVALRDELGYKISRITGMDESISLLEQQEAQALKELEALSHALHLARLEGAARAQNSTGEILNELQLAHAALQFEVVEGTKFDAFGRDEIRLLFKANKGGKLQPIRQVASGGEISRVMLALKAAISRHQNLPVLILDEIDQGVSGEVALRIGEILRAMSSDMQVITITHLPQIAAKAAHQFKVYKTDEREQTTTQVVLLSPEERVEELAEMLGGKKRSQTSIEHAKELLVKSSAPHLPQAEPATDPRAAP